MNLSKVEELEARNNNAHNRHGNKPQQDRLTTPTSLRKSALWVDRSEVSNYPEAGRDWIR